MRYFLQIVSILHWYFRLLQRLSCPAALRIRAARLRDQRRNRRVNACFFVFLHNIYTPAIFSAKRGCLIHECL